MAINSTIDKSKEDSFWKRRQAIQDRVENMNQNTSLKRNMGILPVMDVQEEYASQDPQESMNSSGYNFQQAYESSSTEPQIRGLYDIISPNLRGLSAGEAPVQNQSEIDRLNKVRKRAALGQAISGIFGTVGLAAGMDVPAGIDENPVAASAISRLNQMDERYFNEMARYRDAQLRAEVFNADAHNRAAMETARQIQENIIRGQQQQFEEGQLQKRQEFEAGQNKADRQLRGRAMDIDSERNYQYNQARKMETIQRYEAQYDDLYNRWKIATENFDDETANELLAEMQENMKVRSQLQRQLAQREGFDFQQEEQPSIQRAQNYQFQPYNTFSEAYQAQGAQRPAAAQQQRQQQTQVNQPQQNQEQGQEQIRERRMAGWNKVAQIGDSAGQEITAGQRSEMIKIFSESGYSPEESERLVNWYMEQTGKSLKKQGRSYEGGGYRGDPGEQGTERKGRTY